VEPVNVLSDDSGDVDDDWHYERLAEEDAEGGPWFGPVEVCDSGINWRFLVLGTIIVNWNIKQSNKKTPFSIFLQENHFGNDQLNN